MLRHLDLKSKGLHLTQTEAQAIHAKVGGIAQGHITDGIVYSGESEISKGKEIDPLKSYYAELQGENSKLKTEKIGLLQNIEGLNHKLNNSNDANLALKQSNNELAKEISELKFQLKQATTLDDLPENDTEQLKEKRKPGRKPTIK